jgi:hypothetical protein
MNEQAIAAVEQAAKALTELAKELRKLAEQEPPPPAGYEWVRDEKGNRARPKTDDLCVSDWEYASPGWKTPHKAKPGLVCGVECYAVRPLKARRWVLEEEPVKRKPEDGEPFVDTSGKIRVIFDPDYWTDADKRTILRIVERPE